MIRLMLNYCRNCKTVTGFTEGKTNHVITNKDTQQQVTITNLPFSMCSVCGLKIMDGNALNIMFFASKNNMPEIDFNINIPNKPKMPIVPPERVIKNV